MQQSPAFGRSVAPHWLQAYDTSQAFIGIFSRLAKPQRGQVTSEYLTIRRIARRYSNLIKSERLKVAVFGFSGSFFGFAAFWLRIA